MNLYIYEHCPYCVKARMIFGYKNISVNTVTLLNNDVETPEKLIGQKMVPILERDSGKAFAESLDIIKYIDENFGDERYLDASISDNEKLREWLKQSRDYLYPLAMPRWIEMGLEEFRTPSAKAYFKKKKEDYIGDFKQHLQNTPELTRQAEKHLILLNGLWSSDYEETFESRPSYNDIHLYATLRTLSVVKDLKFPKHVLAFMKKQEEVSQVPLHLNQAL